MFIEPETKIAKAFVKNDFLNQSLEDFTNQNCSINYSDVKRIIKQNKSSYVPLFAVNKAMKSCDKEIKFIFDGIDGKIQRDGIIEKEEVFKVVKDYYRIAKNQQVTDEQIEKLTVLDLLDIIIAGFKRAKEQYAKNAG